METKKYRVTYKLNNVVTIKYDTNYLRFALNAVKRYLDTFNINVSDFVITENGNNTNKTFIKMDMPTQKEIDSILQKYHNC